MLNSNEFLKNRKIQKEAFGLYAEFPNINSPEWQKILQDLPDKVAKRIGQLISINACLWCGRSLASTDTTCEHCGDTQDDVFEILGAIAERGGVGRIAPRGGCH